MEFIEVIQVVYSSKGKDAYETLHLGSHQRTVGWTFETKSRIEKHTKSIQKLKKVLKGMNAVNIGNRFHGQEMIVSVDAGWSQSDDAH